MVYWISAGRPPCAQWSMSGQLVGWDVPGSNNNLQRLSEAYRDESCSGCNSAERRLGQQRHRVQKLNVR